MQTDPVVLPDFFEGLLLEQMGEADCARVLEGCKVRRATTLRANALRATSADVEASLEGAGLSFARPSWYDDAFILPAGSEDVLRNIELYDEGGIYLQSLSSMLPPLALGDCKGLDVLDMCAAPGGKTTQLAALSGNAAHITACEMNGPRAERLQFNLERQGAINVVVMRQDARRLDSFFSFDRILLDAPCSGSGTLSIYDQKMPKRFTQQLIAKSRKSQAALLSKALELLKPGGYLVYSTCSVLKCENEDVVCAALRRANKRGCYKVRPITIAGFDEAPRLPVALDGTICVCPNELYEGFYMAKIERLA